MSRRRRQLLQFFAASAALPWARARAADDEMVVAVNQTTIESAPLLVQSIPGIRVVPVPNGRAASALLVAGDVDAATGSETQLLLNSVNQSDLRVVLTLAECRYRLIARRQSGVLALADLRGKRIAHTPGTSSQYFLLDMLRLGQLEPEDVTRVTLEGPDMPAALAKGEIDAMAMWEPHAQNALELLGADGVVLTHPEAYFERFNLNTTAKVLADPARRALLTQAFTAIAAASGRLQAAPTTYFDTLAKAISTPTAIIDKVWQQFRFPAGLEPEPLLDMMARLEPWAATAAGRAARPRAELAALIDTSLLGQLPSSRTG